MIEAVFVSKFLVTSKALELLLGPIENVHSWGLLCGGTVLYPVPRERVPGTVVLASFRSRFNAGAP